jgi:MFS family permease
MSPGEFRKRNLATSIYLPSLLFTAAEGALLPILPVSATLYGFSLAQAGIITTALMLGTLLFELPASWVNSRIGERRSMLFASIAGALITLSAFFELGYFALLMAAILFGAAHSLFGLARHSLMAELVPIRHRPKSMSLVGGMFRAGAAIGPVIGSAFISLFGLQSGYLAASLICLATAATVFGAPNRTLAPAQSGQNGNIWAVAKRESPKLATLGVAVAILSAGRTIRLIGLPLLAIQLGIDPATASFIFGITGFIDFTLFYLSGIIMDKYGKFWSSVPTLLTLGTVYLFTFMVTDLASFWVLASVTALANALSAGINMVLGADLAPTGSRSEFLAAFRFMVSGGVAVSPGLISLLTAFIGLSGAMASAGLLNFLGAYLFWRYLPKYAPHKKASGN